MYPSVRLDAPPGGTEGIYVQGVYLPVLDAFVDEIGNVHIVIDADRVEQPRLVHAAARHSITSDAE